MDRGTIRCSLVRSTSKLPTKGSDGAAGFDLYADCTEEISIRPGVRVMVPTGIVMEIPFGFYGRVAPRSGLANKHGIDVLAGVIDSDYRGEVKTILINLGQEPVVIAPGERMAQIIIERCGAWEMSLCNGVSDTARGASGFGSTGQNENRSSLPLNGKLILVGDPASTEEAILVTFRANTTEKTELSEGVTYKVPVTGIIEGNLIVGGDNRTIYPGDDVAVMIVDAEKEVPEILHHV